MTVRAFSVNRIGMPPDNTRPPRNLVEPDPRPNLGVRVVMDAVEEIAREKRLEDAHVKYKRNADGRHVVAVIFRGFQR